MDTGIQKNLINLTRFFYPLISTVDPSGPGVFFK